MRVHFLQHALCDGPGNIESHLRGKGHELTTTKLCDNEALPPLAGIDWLIILGGDMGVHDEFSFPWLKQEKEFISRALASDIKILGICLGAQLLAHVLGAKVRKNEHMEIGWFPITRLDQIRHTILSDIIPERIEMFHWHGDTFDIPENAYPIARSPACANQGFIKGNRIVALQFHPEVRMEDARAFLDEVGSGLEASEYIQSGQQILSDPKRFQTGTRLMEKILDAIEAAP